MSLLSGFKALLGAGQAAERLGNRRFSLRYYLRIGELQWYAVKTGLSALRPARSCVNALSKLTTHEGAAWRQERAIGHSSPMGVGALLHDLRGTLAADFIVLMMLATRPFPHDQ
jgi:hypothetical protein